MAKPEWGSKRTCPECTARFYDLGKDEPVTCISCGHVWTPEPLLKSKQSEPAARKPKPVEKSEAKSGDSKNTDSANGADKDDIDTDPGDGDDNKLVPDADEDGGDVDLKATIEQESETDKK